MMTESDVGRDLLAVVSYTDAKRNVDDAARDRAGLVSVNPVAVDTRNRAPVFDDQDSDTLGTQNQTATREVAENTKGGVGSAVTAKDPDPNEDPLIYRLSGADAALFSVAGAGQITVKSGTKLDFETRTTYMVTLTATDSFNDSSSIDVTITVTDVDEAPKIMEGGLGIGGSPSITRAEDATGPVATYTSTGPESASTRWALAGDDRGDFRISSAGVLTFRVTPDYEAPTDANTDNEYSVTVVANDGTNTAIVNVTVTVTDVDEGGTLVGCDVAPVDRYDTDGDGTINRVEVEDAILDFIGIGANPCNISRTEVEDVVLAYLGL